MPFDPDKFLASTATATRPASGFDPDKFLAETEPMSIEGFGKNLVQDVKDTGSGLANLAGQFVQHPLRTPLKMAAAMPEGIVNEGKRLGVGELITGHPINAIQKLGGAFYDKPLTTGLEIAPAVGWGAGKLGLGEKVAAAELGDVAKTAGIVDDILPDGPAGPAASASAPSVPEAPIELKPMRTTPEAPIQPASRVPPDPNAPPLSSKPPVEAAKRDNLDAVHDFLKSKQKKIEAQPGWQQRAAKYVENEVSGFRGKDIGLRDPMIRSLDRKNPLRAIEKAEELMDYGAEEGLFKAGLTDVARKDLVKSRLADAGENIGAVRAVGGNRGVPPIAEIRKAIINGLKAEYGIKAKGEIKSVLDDFDRLSKQDPTFEGMSKVATHLNGEKSTLNKLGRDPRLTTHAADVVSRMNNDALRKLLNAKENTFYTDNLKRFGAYKKFEQTVASAGRRGMTGRGAPGGMFSSAWQQLWDRGGYRIAGNVADRTAKSVLKNPGRIKNLPDFFEELAHHAGDEIDDVIGSAGAQGQGMAHGGIVGNNELNEFLSQKYGNKTKGATK